jgi:DNA polymerase-3 subunit delta'
MLDQVPAAAPYPWQQGQWKLLSDTANAGRLHHAYLISGPAGTGKADFATVFAHALLCENRADDRLACGECARCKLVAAGTHPDFIQLDWIDKATTISVEQIRALTAKLSLTATFEQRRVAIVRRAHSMSAAAANGLLKTLEEPPPGCVILLVADREAALPITIRSRSQRVLMPLPAREVSLAWLEHGGIANGEGLLACSHGAPLTAMRLAGDDTVAGIETLQRQWREFLLGRIEVVPLAEAAAKILPTRECLSLFSAWLIDHARTAEGNADAPVNLARRRYFGEVSRILAHSMRLDNASLKTQAVIEGVLADIKITRARIRAETSP